VDLQLSQNVIPSLTGRDRGYGEAGISARLDLDFICGQFDLKSTFKQLLGKEVREEFLRGVLGYLESELTGSAMELLCQAQPTLCTLLQNHNIAANLKLGYHYDRCQAIESAIDHSQKRVYASAVEQCLKDKQSRGMTLEEAIDGCRRANQVRGFQGESLVEFDLAKELSKLVGLSENGQKLLANVSEGTRYGGNWSATKPNGNAVAARHDEIRKHYFDRWQAAIEEARTKKVVPNGDLVALSPPKSPPVTLPEIQGFARLPEFERVALVNSLASAAALAQLTLEIHEVERALEAVAGAPSIEEAQRKMLEGRIARLRKERSRLEELYRDQAFWRDAYLGALALEKRDFESRVASEREKVALDPARKGLIAKTAPFGSRGPLDASARGGAAQVGSSGASCNNCAGFEFSVGAPR
jgi:hypothetical protein